jgi:hypothetical protein
MYVVYFAMYDSVLILLLSYGHHDWFNKEYLFLFLFIILIPNKPVFALSPSCCVLSVEATITKFIVFDLFRSELEPTIYRNRGEHDIIITPIWY